MRLCTLRCVYFALLLLGLAWVAQFLLELLHESSVDRPQSSPLLLLLLLVPIRWLLLLLSRHWLLLLLLLSRHWLLLLPRHWLLLLLLLLLSRQRLLLLLLPLLLLLLSSQRLLLLLPLLLLPRRSRASRDTCSRYRVRWMWRRLWLLHSRAAQGVEGPSSGRGGHPAAHRIQGSPRGMLH
jgi:hypothetical protein